jgi:hypothetical protein
VAARPWRFKSSLAHHGRLAQLARASALHAEGRGFESPSAHQYILVEYSYQHGSLAQLVEQRLEEPCVPSSSLGGATKLNAPPCVGYLIWLAIARARTGVGVAAVRVAISGYLAKIARMRQRKILHYGSVATAPGRISENLL